LTQKKKGGEPQNAEKNHPPKKNKKNHLLEWEKKPLYQKSLHSGKMIRRRKGKPISKEREERDFYENKSDIERKAKILEKRNLIEP